MLTEHANEAATARRDDGARVSPKGAGGRRTIAVLLCRDLKDTLRLEELCRWLEDELPDVRARVVPDLCAIPRDLFRSTIAGAQRVVLGLCSPDYLELDLHGEARRAGLDPLGVEPVLLGTFCAAVPSASHAMEKATLMLAAAVAKARAYPGSSAANFKPYFPSSQTISRRALFTLPPIHYKVVASIDSQRCVAESGCSACVRACPYSALTVSGDAIQIQQAHCTGCGVCATACPKDAVQLPGAAPVQLDAQISALLQTDLPTLSDRRILFLCPHVVQTTGEKEQKAFSAWLPVQVPSIAMVPASCLLHSVASGVVVGMVPCPGGCSSEEKARQAIDYCQEVLRALGGRPEWVRSVDLRSSVGEIPRLASTEASRPVKETGDGTVRATMFGPGATAAALLRLVELQRTSAPLSLRHAHSPLGIVRVHPQRCTGCGVCAETCSTGALRVDRDEELKLVFDARLCTACGRCASVCPERAARAIHVEKVTDTAALQQGSIELYCDDQGRCEGCGAPVAPRALLRKLAERLGDEDAALAERISRYCSDCKGIVPAQ